MRQGNMSTADHLVRLFMTMIMFATAGAILGAILSDAIVLREKYIFIAGVHGGLILGLCVHFAYKFNIQRRDKERA